jgi:hypothetical protein
MRFSVERFATRLVLFSLCCVLTLHLFGSGFHTSFVAKAVAQEAPPPPPGGEAPCREAGGEEARRRQIKHSMLDMIAHIFKSVGFVMGGVFLILSVSLVALVVLLAMDLRMAMPSACLCGRVHRHGEQTPVQAGVRDDEERQFVPGPGTGCRHGPAAVRHRRRPRGGDEHRGTIKANKEQFVTYATIGSPSRSSG